MQAMLQRALRSRLTTADTTSAAGSLAEAKPEASPKPCSPSRLDSEHMQQEACSSAEGAVRAQEPCPATKMQEPAQVASDSPLTEFTAQQVSPGSLSCLHRQTFCTSTCWPMLYWYLAQSAAVAANFLGKCPFTAIALDHMSLNKLAQAMR